MLLHTVGDELRKTNLTVKRFDFSELNVSESGTVTSNCLDIAFAGNTPAADFVTDRSVLWDRAEGFPRERERVGSYAVYQKAQPTEANFLYDC